MHLYFECVCMFVFTCKCSSVTKGVCEMDRHTEDREILAQAGYHPWREVDTYYCNH